MNYEKCLEFQPMLNPHIRKLIAQLQDGSLSKSRLHSRKAYAKRIGDILAVIEYGVALEIFNMEE